MGDRYPSDWNSRRKKVYKRDNYRCQRCGTRGRSRGNAELHAHHKTPISEGGSHRYSNLTTVCKSCHEDIHGHGVGGHSSSMSNSRSPSNSGDANDAAETAITVVLMALIAFSAITYGAVGQVLPAGQEVSEDYEVSYGTVTDDPDGYGQDHDHNVGPPLQLQYKLSDNVIPENGETTLMVVLHNPSEHRLEGGLNVIGKTSYQYQGEIASLGFDLEGGHTAVGNITLTGEDFVAETGLNPRKTKFNAKVKIFNDPYREISTSEKDITGDKMKLKVRKPFFARLGVYWLGFLVICLAGGGALYWKKRYRQ